MAAVLVASVGVSAQERAPNRRDLVEAVSAADPARFACAHVESRGCKTDWIKAVAWALHQTDSRWGLNGKRGNVNDLSMDVVTWRIGPTDRHVQAFDICVACGGGSPSVVWNDITNWATIGNPGTAVWLRPDPVGDGGAPPPPPSPPPPAPSVDLRPILDAIAALTAKVDAVAALALASREAATQAQADAEQARILASDVKHVELPKVLEQLKQPIPIPCMRGSVYGRGVRFCPE